MAMIYKRRQLKISKDLQHPEYNLIKTQQRLTKSCSIMIIAFLFSEFTCQVSINLVRRFDTSEHIKNLVETYAVIPGVICYAMPYYIYFWSSRMYRTAFKTQWKALVTCRWSVCVKSGTAPVFGTLSAKTARTERTESTDHETKRRGTELISLNVDSLVLTRKRSHSWHH
ncbi:hypothetical protein L596_023097 [Steinernema carpocapsae]|uniref:G-protein coupled receptors family 1 profile domain-containing protein n=1 Tax=Steinernema carpocapsae TaxID=34508 RepID=A0A4V6XVT9_STECR|nr:hypothetical protein L596_023097 [Steinernema carpocapsae]